MLKMGYVSDVMYTNDYHLEINPERIRLAFLKEGIIFPEIKNACDLGCGTGLNMNLHSSSSTIKWFGNDFLPHHINLAKEIEKATSTGAKFYNESFEEFINNVEVPNFDYISIHGIWSWVSEDVRNTLLRFISKKLNPGGVVFISYNTLPGNSNLSALQYLIAEHVKWFGNKANGSIDNLKGSFEFIDKFKEEMPLFQQNLIVNQKYKIIGSSLNSL